MKLCKKCGELKPLDEFYRSPGMRDGRRNDCIPCNNAAKTERNRANPEANRDRVKGWREANPERHNEYQRTRRARPEVKARDRAGHLARKFGITLEEYDQMLAAQSGGCALCGATPLPGASLHVDHDHRTGFVRGLLCFKCNGGLGQFAESPDLLEAAAEYVVGHSLRARLDGLKSERLAR